MLYIKQQDSMDCGPSCLAMIARHYGLKPNIDEIRSSCSLGKDGVSLLGISKTAEKLGFKTVGGRLPFETLIVHWNQNHFVVVYKIKKHKKGTYTVYVADPGKGLLTYTNGDCCTMAKHCAIFVIRAWSCIRE